MKKLKLAVTIGALSLCMCSISALANSSTEELKPNQSGWAHVSTGKGYAKCDYDWGTWAPNDDAIMTVRTLSPAGKTSKSYARIKLGKIDVQDRKQGFQGICYTARATHYKVDLPEYARGLAQSSVGTADIKVKK